MSFADIKVGTRLGTGFGLMLAMPGHARIAAAASMASGFGRDNTDKKRA